VGGLNQMKIFKFLFAIPVITLIIIFQTSLHNRYLMASDIRDGERIFRNVCAGCHVRGGSVVLKGSKSLKLSDLEKRGIANYKFNNKNFSFSQLDGKRSFRYVWY